MAKKLTKRDLLKIEHSRIGKMDGDELKPLVDKARALLKAQAEKFKKYEKSVYSPALDQIKDFYRNFGARSVKDMKRGDLQHELIRIQDFFESESSTIPGARKIAIEQDRRIFGVKTKDGISYTEKSGKPIQRMTVAQRKSYWSAYMEYTSLKGEAYTRNLSDVIQQYLGEMLLSGVSEGEEALPFDMEHEDWAALFNELSWRIKQKKDQEEWELSGYDYRDSDVSSGKRPY